MRKNLKLYVIVIFVTVCVYLLMLVSLHIAHNIEKGIAMGYIERTCELVGDQSGKWYECTK